MKPFSVFHRETAKRIIGSICFILVLALCLYTLKMFFEAKNSRQRSEKFWENPGDYDVWLLGTSHMYYGINPMDLWEQNGCTAYNLASPSSYMPQTYWTLKNALQFSSPKLVVLDTFHVQQAKKHVKNEKKIHTGFDAIPFSKTKVDAVLDLFRSRDDRVEYLWNFSIYHNRWEELTTEDLYPEYNKMNGAFYKVCIADQSSYEFPPEDQMNDGDAVGYQYLELIIEECTSRDIPILLLSIPSCSNAKAQIGMNTVRTVAEKYDVPFLNVPYMDHNIDYSFDFADVGHLNPSGSEKMTRMIANYIREHYDLPDHRTDAAVAGQYNIDYRQYRDYKASQINEQEQLPEYLTLLRDESYQCYACRGANVSILDEILVSKLIKNVSHLTWVSDAVMQQLCETEATDDDQIRFCIVEKQTGSQVSSAVFDNSGRKVSQ